jgi:hypothetical protein
MTNKIVGSREYSIGTLDVFTQLNVARRLMAVSPILEALINPENQGKDFTPLIILTLGKLSQEDSDYVVRTCIGVVTVRDNNQWCKIATPQGSLMYQDITMKTMVDLATAVILENLGDFFHTALFETAEGAGETAA